jgi:hypothetical protein
MKAKMYRYIYSFILIFICLTGKSQTTDGVLYTNFNNYYKWRGGAFDSTLLLPTIAASIGRRPGALRYNTTDSSVYSWTGTQWQKIGQSTASDTATVVKAYVTNAEAVTITKGQVVYIFGASGDRASVKLAKNTSDTFSSKTLGIVRENIASGAAGWITTQGQVSGINLGAYTAGDILWLDSIPGGFTKTKPQAPYHAVFVGVVERANAGNGLIYVKPQNGVELDELHDVRITSVANNDIIRYNSSLGYWENKSITNTLGYTPLNVTDTSAMLSPYLRSNSAGVRWAGNDSTFSYQMARNGKHVNGDFDFLASANILGGNGDAINFFATIGASAGTFTALNSSGINGVTLSTSNSSTGQANIGYGYTTTLKPFSFATTDPALSTYRVKLNNLNDGTDRFFIQIGFIDAFGTNIANGYYFTYDLSGTQTGSATSANWQCVTANGSTRTWTTTSTAVATGSWATFAIRVTTSKVIFYINNSIVAEHTTNITTNNTAMSTRIIKTNGTNARTMDVDYITFDQWYSTLR